MSLHFPTLFDLLLLKFFFVLVTELKAVPNDSVVIAFPEISLVRDELFEISLVRLVFGPVVEKFVVMKF